MSVLSTLLRLRPRTPLEIAVDALLGRRRAPLTSRLGLGGRPAPLGRSQKKANPLVALLGGLVASRVLGGRRRRGASGLLPGLLGAAATAALSGGTRGRRR